MKFKGGFHILTSGLTNSSVVALHSMLFVDTKIAEAGCHGATEKWIWKRRIDRASLESHLEEGAV